MSTGQAKYQQQLNLSCETPSMISTNCLSIRSAVAQAALFYCTQFLSMCRIMGFGWWFNKSITTEEGLVPWSGVGSRITCAVYPVLSPPCNQRWYSGSHYTLLQSHNSPAQTILPTMGSTLLNPPQWRFGVWFSMNVLEWDLGLATLLI